MYYLLYKKDNAYSTKEIQKLRKGKMMNSRNKIGFILYFLSSSVSYFFFIYEKEIYYPKYLK